MPDERPGFDHTSIGVRDATRWAPWVRRELGATAVMGEVLPAFRYVLFHVGNSCGGAGLELMDSCEPAGFLGRFLDELGEGPHHLSFVVPDVEATIRAAEALSFNVVGIDLKHPPWREAFIMPDDVHGTVIQVADSIHDYPRSTGSSAVAQLCCGRCPVLVVPPSATGGTSCVPRLPCTPLS